MPRVRRIPRHCMSDLSAQGPLVVVAALTGGERRLFATGPARPEWGCESAFAEQAYEGLPAPARHLSDAVRYNIGFMLRCSNKLKADSAMRFGHTFACGSAGVGRDLCASIMNGR